MASFKFILKKIGLVLVLVAAPIITLPAYIGYKVGRYYRAEPSGLTIMPKTAVNEILSPEPVPETQTNENIEYV